MAEEERYNLFFQKQDMLDTVNIPKEISTIKELLECIGELNLGVCTRKMIFSYVPEIKHIISTPFVSKCSLDELHVLAILLLEGGYPDFIQDTAFGTSNRGDLSKFLVYKLDEALKKMPATDSECVFRNTEFGFPNMEVGKIIKVPGFFTTSKDDFDKKNIDLYSNKKFIIKTSQNTRAHDMFKVRDKITGGLPESQIEFERGTSFRIEKMEQNRGKKIIYLLEID